MSGNLVLRADADGCCTLTLNRPDKLNALDTATFSELKAHLDAIADDAGIGCVVVRGAGRGFCAGADLKAMGSVRVPPDYKPGIVAQLGTLPQPVIAAIHGVCLTGGLELALACDFLLADATARFADTHGKWGLVGQWGISQRLPRRIGLPRAKRMMMTARMMDAEEALAIGLVDALAPEGALDALVADWTTAILANSWHTNRAVKRFAIATDGMGLPEALAHEAAHHPGFAPDHQERLARFGKSR